MDPVIDRIKKELLKSHKKPAVVKGLMKLAEEDLVAFKLDPDAEANISRIGDMCADSNLGGTGDGRMIRDCQCDGVDPWSEIKAWTSVASTAERLADKFDLPITNRVIFHLMNHKTASKQYLGK